MLHIGADVFADLLGPDEVVLDGARLGNPRLPDPIKPRCSGQ